MTSLETVKDLLLELLGYVSDPNKRLYYLYLLSACLLAVPVYRRTKPQKNLKNFAAYLFNSKVWLAPSAKQDYALLVVNKLIKAVIYAPAILLMVPVALWFGDVLNNNLGPVSSGSGDFVAWPRWAIITSFTAALFLLDDFSRFVLHYLLHKVPPLWQFHKVHHSATVLTPFTVYRSHPVESYLYACRMALSQGLVVGGGYYIFGPNLKMFDIAGANVFVFVFNLMGSNLRHSHVWLSWGRGLENWFISPAQHQIHHSDNPSHFDTNLGSALAIWDRVLGTLIKADDIKGKGAGRLRFGLGKGNTEHQSLLAIYIQPFIGIFSRRRE
ncbi:MAG: sterol desaturase family protein [Algicola sp.]|nr:sterol desaturase family protein [Algicola sp.]